MLFRFILLVVVGVIAALLWKSWENSPDSEPFISTLVEVDTAVVDVIEVHHPDALDDHLLLRRVDGKWIGNLGSVTFSANHSQVDSLLSPIQSIQSVDIAGPLNDWLSRPFEVRYYQEGTLLEVLQIGKTVDSTTIITEVTIGGHQDRYWVSGALRPFFERDFQAYRSFAFLSIEQDEVEEVGISLDPSTFISLQKDSSDWESDSWVSRWLEQLAKLEGEKYSDEFDAIAHRDQLVCAIRLSFQDGTDSVGIYIYEDTTAAERFTLNSSQFPNRYFRSDSTGLFQKVFPMEILKATSLISQ